MEPSYYRTFATVDTEAIRHNFRLVRQQVGNKKILSVIKADGYGHGAVETARALPDSDYFGVACLSEAILLREAGIETPILILGYTSPQEAGFLAQYQLIQCVFSAEYAEALAETLRREGKRLKVHYKIDTGMSRLGLPAQSDEEIQQTCRQLLELAKKLGDVLTGEGIFTHFTSSEEKDDPFTLLQFRRFCRVLDTLEQNGLRFPLRHAANSAAIFHFPQTHLDMVRPGIVLYGLPPAASMPFDFRPAMELKTHVAQVHTLHKGETVSYNRTFRAPRDMQIATICVGYADGYPRALSNKAEVLIHGRRTRILGKVCMDQCIIDATGIPIQTGDLVTLFGHSRDAFLGTGELAEKAGTIHYEIICGISKRIPRFYI